MTRSKPYMRGVFVLFLLAGLAAGMVAPTFAPVRAAAPLLATACSGTDITLWKFDGTSGTILPFTGSGTLSQGNGLAAPTFVTGSIGPAPTDWAASFTDWTITSNLDPATDKYVEFDVDTTGRTSISLSFQYESNPSLPAVVNLDVYYSTDGTTFTKLGSSNILVNGLIWNSLSSAIDFSAITALNNNPSAKFRLYVYSNTLSTITFNLDNVLLSGNCTPLPPTPCPNNYHSLLINEVAWTGTTGSTSSHPDQWIELYNPSACAIDLNGWNLIGTNIYYSTGRFTITFDAAAGAIPPGGYYVIASNDGLFQNLTPNLVPPSPGIYLPSSYEVLQLISPSSTLVDTANHAGSYYWPAGSTSNDASMERYPLSDDGPAAWVTYAGPTVTTVKDRNGNWVQGTPGGPNWTNLVTLTPSPVPTATTRPRTPTAIPPTPFAHLVINEFLPRAGFDWNNDGLIDVNDEFIEIENLGPINVNLSGWKLSDDPNIGNKTFALPAQTLKPGQRMVFYGSTTHILLVDSGDTIRLTNSRGVIVDARGYGVVKYPDQSHCRIPDGDGYWQQACFPTPGNQNVLTGVVPASPPAKIDQPVPCLLPDTTPLEFRLAVCSPFGADVWNPKYWDGPAGGGRFVIPDPFGKGWIIVE